ncbi:MAG: transporter permease, partial [Candidatus Eremiobacteraeota bacterium]|nr:transporter permease [Candidatus Eremiobacteraeota bacterium]
VATLDPAQLLFAKILAATATSFVQLAVWIGTSLVVGKTVAGFFAEGSAAVGNGPELGVTAPEILWFIVFFVIGFVQCAVLFAAAGSLVNRSEDVGSVSGPLYIPIIGAYIIAQFALQYPNAPNVVAFSFVPLVAPFVMFTRVVVGSVPAWQLVVSISLNVLAAFALARFGGRIYRVGMLMYGRPPSPRQIVAAMRQR